jgi:hypothetical protein
LQGQISELLTSSRKSPREIAAVRERVETAEDRAALEEARVLKLEGQVEEMGMVLNEYKNIIDQWKVSGEGGEGNPEVDEAEMVIIRTVIKAAVALATSSPASNQSAFPTGWNFDLQMGDTVNKDFKKQVEILLQTRIPDMDIPAHIVDDVPAYTNRQG